MREGKYEAFGSGSTGTAITFLLIGLGAGALIGLLFAPKAGKQLRKELRSKYDDARETIDDWREDVPQNRSPDGEHWELPVGTDCRF